MGKSSIRYHKLEAYATFSCYNPVFQKYENRMNTSNEQPDQSTSTVIEPKKSKQLFRRLLWGMGYTILLLVWLWTIGAVYFYPVQIPGWLRWLFTALTAIGIPVAGYLIGRAGGKRKKWLPLGAVLAGVDLALQHPATHP